MQEICRIGQDFLHISLIGMKCCPILCQLCVGNARKCHILETEHVGNLNFGPVDAAALYRDKLYWLRGHSCYGNGVTAVGCSASACHVNGMTVNVYNACTSQIVVVAIIQQLMIILKTIHQFQTDGSLLNITCHTRIIIFF